MASPALDALPAAKALLASKLNRLKPAFDAMKNHGKMAQINITLSVKEKKSKDGQPSGSGDGGDDD